MEQLEGGAMVDDGLAQLVEQLNRHCLAPDGSYVAKAAYYDLVQAREEMGRERLRFLEVMAAYSEAVTLVEEFQQAISVANAGGIRDVQALFLQLGLRSTPQVYEALEERLAVAEACQRLRLPSVTKDGDILDEEAEKCSIVSKSSLDSSTTSISMSSSNTSTPNPSHDVSEVGVSGVVNRFLGITPAWLRQTHLSKAPFAEDSTGYLMLLIPEIESRLKAKCEKISSSFQESDGFGSHGTKSYRLAERVKAAVESNESEEAALLSDLYSADRKFSEYYNVLEQILGVLIKLVKDYKLQHQHEYDEMRKAWLCKRCETMNAKLRVLEHLVLRDTYTEESIAALHKIRNYLLEADDEATAGYNRAVTRLREYQGVDQYFDDIARRYHDVVKKLEGIQWTIRQVEMDLNNGHEH
ncbi:AUGMIN subunit 4 [Selaginella moellendorffii]|uniref:AUGMIN subunit 4 n=1 Tax=Selaginella moellendorffii TaxID=88036 RepID=UPI000D1C679B|nr:AUGMIN subunit 4 [Selaginella moellendorffii]|eukprot:XP_024519609.1 AUGMIN subunit 4 [Selaginella moellendorffii]